MAMVGDNVCLPVDPLLSADHIVSTLSKKVHNSRAGDWDIRKGTDSPPTVRRRSTRVSKHQAKQGLTLRSLIPAREGNQRVTHGPTWRAT
jgi:hypothetical protein